MQIYVISKHIMKEYGIFRVPYSNSVYNMLLTTFTEGMGMGGLPSNDLTHINTWQPDLLHCDNSSVFVNC